MKIAVKIFAIAGIVTGFFCFMGFASQPTAFQALTSVVAGIWWVAWGICDLVLLNQITPKV